jgi:hypothetical protein
LIAIENTAEAVGRSGGHFHPGAPTSGRPASTGRNRKGGSKEIKMTTQAIKAAMMLILIITVAFMTAVVTANS